jgi:hypothetical protein
MVYRVSYMRGGGHHRIYQFYLCLESIDSKIFPLSDWAGIYYLLTRSRLYVLASKCRAGPGYRDSMPASLRQSAMEKKGWVNL